MPSPGIMVPHAKSMFPPVVIVVAFIGLVLSACQSERGDPPQSRGTNHTIGGSSTTALAANPFTEEPNPLDVEIELGGVSDSQSIGSDGGSLTVTTAGGVTFQLVVPANALVFDTMMTMTPIQISGWAAQPENFAAVQLEPSGLEFLDPAILTIQVPEPVEIAATGSVGYDGDGLDLRPVLADSLSGIPTIPITHFSGYGFVWNITEDYWDSWQGRRQRSNEKSLEAEVAVILGHDRQRQMLGMETVSLLDLLASIVSQWYDAVYEPRMDRAGNSCIEARVAAEGLRTFWRTIQLSGADLSDVYWDFHDSRTKQGSPPRYTFESWPENFEIMLIGLCDKEALEACVRTGDIVNLVLYVKDRQQMFDLVGGPPPEVGDGSAMLDLCARYELTMTVNSDYTSMGWQSLDDTQIPTNEGVTRNVLSLVVRLHWKPKSDVHPWLGEIVGEGTPVAEQLEWRYRTRVIGGGDHGIEVLDWGPWTECVIGPIDWPRWRVQLSSLEFAHEGEDRLTREFLDATIVFDELIAPLTTHTCSNGSSAVGNHFTYGFTIPGPGVPPWVFSSEPDLAATSVSGWHAERYPLIASREWIGSETITDIHLLGGGEKKSSQEARLELIHVPPT